MEPLLGALGEPLGSPWGALGEALGAPTTKAFPMEYVMASSWGASGNPWEALGRFWGGFRWEVLGSFWGRLGSILARLGGFFEGSGRTS